jgi:hypothetical protein
MLRVDPNERVEINDVVAYCEKHIAQLNAAPNDIIEKLHLLNYLKLFCTKYGRKPISRTYFAIKAVSEDTEIKVRYFVELSYWLMSLGIEESKANSATK